MENIIQKINDTLNGNVVFVGGVAEYMNGTKDYYNDIDISTPNPYPLLYLAPMRIFTNNEIKWARMEIDNIQVDIWIEPLPECREVDGIKYETTEAMISHYEKVLENNWQDRYLIIKKLKRLRNEY